MTKAIPRIVCPVCAVPKLPRQFPPGSRRRACKDCRSARIHAQGIKRTYGITAEEYQALLAFQDGRCAICGNKPKRRRLAVEHDHKTREIRGLTCTFCNHHLLMAASSGSAAYPPIEVAQRLVDYLAMPPARECFGGRFVERGGDDG